MVAVSAQDAESTWHFPFEGGQLSLHFWVRWLAKQKKRKIQIVMHIIYVCRFLR